MRAWATGVTIVAAQANGVQHGMTLNSFTSISLEPPLILVCIENDLRTLSLIEQSGAFAVSVLRAHHKTWSDRFAGRLTENANRFEGIATRTEVTGAPIVAEALAYFDCSVEKAYQAGTHTILIGRVEAAAREEGDPLLYWNRDYRRLQNY